MSMAGAGQAGGDDERAALVERLNALEAELDLVSRDRTVLRRQAASDLRSHIDDALDELQRLRGQVKRSRAELDGLRADNEQLQAEREAMLASRAWRATEPLRRAAGIARRPGSGPEEDS